MNDDPFSTQLQQVISERFPDRDVVRVTYRKKLNGGVESDVFQLTVTYRSGGGTHQQQMILRLFPDAIGSAKSRQEARALRWLNQAGFPAPAMYHAATIPEPLGQPFTLIEFIPGVPLQEKLGQASRQAEWITAFCQLFARLHSLARPADEPVLSQNEVVNWLDALIPAGFELIFESALAWLRSEQIGDWETAVTHNDFSPGNVLVQPDGRLVVIDWTAFMLTDPRVDLGWTLFSLQLNGLAEWETAVLQEYRRFSPHPIEHIDYFKALASIRFLAYMAQLATLQGPDAVGQPFLRAIIQTALEQFTAVSRIPLLALKQKLNSPV